ncbi:hypothetical protein ACF0H5_020149 [Mactra antiquata]
MAYSLNLVLVLCCLFGIIQAGPGHSHGHAHHKHANPHSGPAPKKGTGLEYYEVYVQIYSGKEAPTWNYTMQHVKNIPNVKTILTAIEYLSNFHPFKEQFNKELDWNKLGYTGFEIIHYVDSVPQHTWFLHACFNNKVEDALLNNIPKEYNLESFQPAINIIRAYFNQHCPLRGGKKRKPSTKKPK